MILPKEQEDYQKKTETRLKKIRTNIITLEKQVKKAEADIEVRYDQKMEQLRGQYDQVKAKLEDLGQARQNTWADQKNELDRAIDVLSEAIDNLNHHISA